MIRSLFLTMLFCGCTFMVSAEDGSKLWLRQADKTAMAAINCSVQSPVLSIAQNELEQYWKGKPVSLQFFNDPTHKALGKDGYTIRSTEKESLLELPRKPDYSMLLITYFGYRPLKLIYLTCTSLNVLPMTCAS